MNLRELEVGDYIETELKGWLIVDEITDQIKATYLYDGLTLYYDLKGMSVNGDKIVRYISVKIDESDNKYIAYSTENHKVGVGNTQGDALDQLVYDKNYH